MLRYCRSTYKIRNKLLHSNQFLILCILFILFCLILNQRSNTKTQFYEKSNDDKSVTFFIDRIRDIAILDENFLFNVTYNITINGIPQWLYRYEITHFFNFYWLQNGGYLWHLQRLMDFKEIDTKPIVSQIFNDNFDQKNIYDYLYQHPEYGVIIDTAPDPIQPLFSPLPGTSLSLDETCEHYEWLSNWYPCYRRSEMISSFSLKPLITYALYDVTIDICHQSKHLVALKPIHYDEVIYLFDSKEQIIHETVFVRQILPRLIRLLAFVPTSTLILLPYLNSNAYVKQYMDVLIERGLVNDRKHFIEYNSCQSYHANVVYSTSSPRSDVILLNQVLLGNKPAVRRELILVLRNNFDQTSYHEIIQTINQFELPKDFDYLHIHEFNENTSDSKQIGDLFRQARIVIGMPTDILSHIVWCLPRTHIIEVIDKNLRTDYYEISLQLKLNYWLAMTTKTNKIDIIDFRNLMMKVLMDIDV